MAQPLANPDVRVMLQVVEMFRPCCHTCGWFGHLMVHRRDADAEAEAHRKEHHE